MEYCNQCSAEQNCKLLDNFQQSDNAYRNQLETLEELKSKLVSDDKKDEILQEQKSLVREHNDYKDTIYSLAISRGCPYSHEF